MSVTKIYRGSTVRGKIQLRQKDSVNPDLENQYIIPVGALIEVKFPGEVSTVVLSTANVGEISIVDSQQATIAFVMTPAKSLLLKLSDAEADQLAAVDVVVTDNSVSPATIDMFEKQKVYEIVDQINQ